MDRIELRGWNFLLVIITSFCFLLPSSAQVRVGAERLELLLPLIEGRSVAIMANQTSIIGTNKTNLVDTLCSLGVDVKKIFVPEHGFRGSVDAGKYVKNGRDERTGLPIISLYGRRKRPKVEDLQDVDIVIFDLQDVGTRFYTYISSMHYIMEAVAEQDKKMIVCDRPNPNDFVDGPMREDDCKSFISLHKIPLLHGLTIGELALMINGERWLRHNKVCDLSIISVQNWRHGQTYDLPIEPSPNLRDMQAVRLYPTICLFEPSIMSLGRGTDKPFKVLGYPNKAFGKYKFRPHQIKGQALNPKLKGKRCYGIDLSSPDSLPERSLSLKWLIYYNNLAKKKGLKLIKDRRTFELLVGNKRLYYDLEQEMSEEAIRSKWQKDLKTYKRIRKKYLIYLDKEINGN